MKSSIREQFNATPLVWFASALLAGSLLASLWHPGLWTWVGLGLLALAAAVALRRLRPSARLAILLLPVIFCVGAARYQMTQTAVPARSIAQFNDIDQKIYVTGTVDQEPDVRDTFTNLRLKVTAVDSGSGDTPAEGSLLVVLDHPYDVTYGDTVRVHGYVRTPATTEDFSYRDYLARQGILSTMQTPNLTILPGTDANLFQALLYVTHAKLVTSVYTLFPSPEDSLISGILLGSDKGIPADISKAFQDTGTSHIIAISGFNIAIVAAVLVLLCGRLFGKRWGAVISIVGILFYTVLVGASPSVVRAAIMGCMAVLAVLLERRNLALSSLAAAAGLMVLIDPLVLWDAGFQLSFAATLGLVFYAAPLSEVVTAWIERRFPQSSVRRFAEPISEYFLLTFAAQFTTLPITIYYFHRLSLVSFIANPLVLPAQPALMILSGAAVSLSRIYHPLGQAVAFAAWPFATYTIRVVEFLATIPYGNVALGQFSLLTAAAFYGILLAVTLTWPRFKDSVGPGLVFGALAVLTVLVWRSVFNLPDGRLHLVFMDVGSADAVLVTTPNGSHVLINGGPSASDLSAQLGRLMPPFNRSLDGLIIASTQENQVAGLPRVLQQYRPATTVWAGNPQASYSSGQLKSWLEASHIPIRKALSDDRYDLGGGVTLHVLTVSARGAVLQIEMGNFKALLPVGVNDSSFADLNNGAGLGPVNVLLLSESGYGPSNPPGWLANLKPEIAILSVAAGDPDGLPSPQVSAAFDGRNLLSTDLHGWIDLSTDGQQTWVTAQYK